MSLHDNGQFGAFFQVGCVKRSRLRYETWGNFAPCKKNARQAVAVAFNVHKKPLKEWE
jgi:uncharacterized protein YfaQ (DUF2300 family)